MHDPHIWFDVALWAEILPFITDELIAYDIEHMDAYADNSIKYQKELLELDSWVLSR